jgi:hypothetical protein
LQLLYQLFTSFSSNACHTSYPMANLMEVVNCWMWFLLRYKCIA